MRKLFTFLCAAMMLPASAQWTPCDSCLTLLGNGEVEYQEPTPIRKADGSTLFAYRTFGIQTNPETGQKEAEKHFYLYMQMLDKDGNKMLGDSGVLVSYKPTLTSSYGYVNIDTLANGNVLLTNGDVRYGKGPVVPGIFFPSGIRSYAYCYTQDGQPVWSPDGIEMPYYVMDSTATGRLYAQEQIIVSGDKIYFAAQMEEMFIDGDTSHSFGPDHDSYKYYFEMVCMDYAGNILAQRIDSTLSTFRYSLRPAPNGDAYLVYVNENDGYSAQRIGPDLNGVWAQPTVIESYPAVSRDSASVHAEEPRYAVVLNDSSLAVVCRAFRSIGGSSQLYYNRLYPDGSALADAVLLTDTIGQVADHVFLIEGDTLTLLELRNHPVSSVHNEYYLYLNRILLDGTTLNPTIYGYWISEETNVRKHLIGAFRNGNYYELLSNNQDYNTMHAPSYCYTITVDGKNVFRKPIINEDLLLYEYSLMSDGMNANIIFTKEMFGAQGMWMACIDVTDHTHSAPETGELPGKFTVNAEGKQVNFSKGNLQYLPVRPAFNFATAQWEVRLSANTFVKYTLVNWIDLFGWGTGNDPLDYSTDNADYPAFYEWGENPIMNSSYEAGTWRTLSDEEWDYILNGRPDAANKRGFGSINFRPEPNKYGYILLPDTFEVPQGLHFDPTADNYDKNCYLPIDWKKMQDAGAVFLAYGGYRTDTTIYDYDHINMRGSKGHYWSTSVSGDSQAKAVSIGDNGLVLEARDRSQGLSVRLVKDVEDPTEGIKDIKVTDDNKTRKILRNGLLFIERNGHIYNAQGALVK